MEKGTKEIGFEIKRGEIYLARLEMSDGHEQYGCRPVLILQNDKGNKYSPTTIVASITKRDKKKNFPTHVILPKEVGLKAKSVVQLEQIRVIDKKKLDKYIGRVSDEIMKEIDKKINVSLSLGNVET